MNKHRLKLEAVKKFSELESLMNEMTNLIFELRATNEKQRVEYENQLHRQKANFASKMPPLRVPSNVSGAQPSHFVAKPDEEPELIPAAPGLTRPERECGRSREHRANNVDPINEALTQGGASKSTFRFFFIIITVKLF